MTELVIVLICALVSAVVTAAYHAIMHWLEHKDDCKHTWSNWQDPVKGDGYPYQLRACTKCNQWQSRGIR
jgi:hypothetical protein